MFYRKVLIVMTTNHERSEFSVLFGQHTNGHQQNLVSKSGEYILLIGLPLHTHDIELPFVLLHHR